MKLYILEIGDYSDQYIAGVFSTRENAEMAGECYPNDSKYVSEFDLDIHCGQPPGMKMFEFQIRVSDGYLMDLRITPPQWCRGEYVINVGNDAIRGVVWARDHDHATKIASEHRQAALRQKLLG